MIKLGVNSVLYRDYDFATAVKQIAECGYDGVEVSAIDSMNPHLELGRWRDQASEVKAIVADAGIEFLSMEATKLDEEWLMLAFDAAAEIGIPVVNVGPGGKTGVEEDISASIEMLAKMSDKAHEFGVALCVKAHVGSAIHDTPTTLRAMQEISSPGFGIDMDPSHIHRAGENPEEALPAVLSRVKHVHIRDCKGRQHGPGIPRDQACGRGDIDLYAYCRAMVDGGYDGPVCLEVIGAKDHELPLVNIIAAETYGYLNACLKSLGGR
jgi:sugar phosphate isomerase/epimerase